MVVANKDLNEIKKDYENLLRPIQKRLIVCAGTGCVSNGSLKVLDQLVKEIESRELDVLVKLEKCTCRDELIHISKSGCQGFCQMGPLVTVLPDNILYNKVKPEDVPEIVEQTIMKDQLVERLLYEKADTKERCAGFKSIPFYTRQQRTILKECGFIDPEDIREYIYFKGYEAAKMAYCQFSAKEICQQILESGLRGRGGGGFPTGKKWELTRIQKSEKKYIICNGDEGDPGAFMDRSVMEGNPHAVIEGMMIAARAIGADEGYIYVRAEYPLAVERMNKAVQQAEFLGLLGDRLFGTEQGFKLHVMEGAGAFVCGEETALISSIEGNRGMPKPKPPFPAVKGLYNQPTVINNVETLASIPLIIREGVSQFKKIGTPNSPGTKTFALTGHVANTGLIEVPFGTTLGEILYNIGGGITNNKGDLDPQGFKAVQIGGPSGGCLVEEHLNLPLDFDSLQKVGAMVGSGGLVAMNNKTCMVQIARFFMQFTQNESCGKCILCREGTKQLLALLDDVIEGRGTEETLVLMEKLALSVKKASLCGLGKTAPNPVLSTLKYFEAEYKAHVIDKKCPTGQCKALAPPLIIAEKCKGCSLCAKKCPVEAISGELKKPFVIDEDKCIKCGACAEACKFQAIEGVNS
ncbi:MAG: 4Fe-4S binding protein [Spirochaetes bacterium]|nr:4Fe-4S binding protein [Spirochaetota bacterium]